MAICSHWPWASDRKSVLLDFSVCTLCLFYEMYFTFSSPIIPVFFSHTCLHWANLTLDVMWIHSGAKARLLMHSVWLSALWKEKSSIPEETRRKVNGKRIFNILNIPSFFISSEFLSMKFVSIWLSGQGFQSTRYLSDGYYFVVIHCEVWQHLLQCSCCLWQ